MQALLARREIERRKSELSGATQGRVSRALAPVPAVSNLIENVTADK
jgi:hypothetical protein